MVDDLKALGHWWPVRDGDPRVLALFKRHYSYHEYKDNRRMPGTKGFVRKIMGPGEYMLLLTQECDALFGWLHPVVETLDGQEGVRCSVFRNEGPLLSSVLIQEACELAWRRWPGLRLYTYVDAKKLRTAKMRQQLAGECFVRAGWVPCGLTKVNKLLILEKCSG